jgi:hypothetical protein
MILIPFPIEKCILACWFSAISIPPPVLPINLTYISILLPQLSWANLPYTYCTSDIAPSKSHVHFPLLRSIIQRISPCLRLLVNFRNNFIFYGKELLAPRPTPKLDDHPLSAVCDCLFNIFACPPYLEAISSIRNLMTRHTVVTRDPPNMGAIIYFIQYISIYSATYYRSPFFSEHVSTINSHHQVSTISLKLLHCMVC